MVVSSYPDSQLPVSGYQVMHMLSDLAYIYCKRVLKFIKNQQLPQKRRHLLHLPLQLLSPATPLCARPPCLSLLLSVGGMRRNKPIPPPWPPPPPGHIEPPRGGARGHEGSDEQHARDRGRDRAALLHHDSPATATEATGSTTAAAAEEEEAAAMADDALLMPPGSVPWLGAGFGGARPRRPGGTAFDQHGQQHHQVLSQGRVQEMVHMQQQQQQDVGGTLRSNSQQQQQQREQWQQLPTMAHDQQPPRGAVWWGAPPPPNEQHHQQYLPSAPHHPPLWYGHHHYGGPPPRRRPHPDRALIYVLCVAVLAGFRRLSKPGALNRELWNPETLHPKPRALNPAQDSCL